MLQQAEGCCSRPKDVAAGRRNCSRSKELQQAGAIAAGHARRRKACGRRRKACGRRNIAVFIEKGLGRHRMKEIVENVCKSVPSPSSSSSRLSKHLIDEVLGYCI
ncbi:hypothetical protein SLEP1_g15682 [Rubroshorea leprosula]|uniref:Uncharacterized protein n=1 Tax=Rubroshorea leprosula TaxID=152421 RepID=A0AAV5IU92_9ROSI|nr:hypothetical protein SLEP1_g15682 [Rubroshorea leprosula]